jgi:UDP-sugar transporter A1/2/3
LDKVEENSSKSYQEQSRWVGVLAVLGACCTSGFGGVYFELVLKPRSSEPPGGGVGRIHPPPRREPPSVWAKNVQLSVFALLIALVASFVKDHAAILAGGFFQGYSPLVVLVVMLEAGGGLVVAVVIKYADNILKSFATAVSIVTSTIVSALVFGFTVSKLFVCGCLFVFAAIVLYSRDDDDDVDVDVDVGKAGGEEGGAAMPSSARRDRYLPAMQAGTSRDSADCSEDDGYDVDEDDGMAEIAMTDVDYTGKSYRD